MRLIKWLKKKWDEPSPMFVALLGYLLCWHFLEIAIAILDKDSAVWKPALWFTVTILLAHREICLINRELKKVKNDAG